MMWMLLMKNLLQHHRDWQKMKDEGKDVRKTWNMMEMQAIKLQWRRDRSRDGQGEMMQLLRRWRNYGGLKWQ